MYILQHGTARVSVTSLWFHNLTHTYVVIISLDIKDNLSCLNIVPSNKPARVNHASLAVCVLYEVLILTHSTFAYYQ